MPLCLLQLQPVVYFPAFPHGWQNATFPQGFPSWPAFLSGVKLQDGSKSQIQTGFKGASTLLLSGNTAASKILHQSYFSLQTQKRRRRRSRTILMVEGNWDLFLCSPKNLSGIFRIPAALSDAGEGWNIHWDGEQCKEHVGGIFLENWVDFN